MKPIFVIQIANPNSDIQGDTFHKIVEDMDVYLRDNYHVIVELCPNLEVSKYHLFSIDNVTDSTIEELKKLLSIKEIQINE